MPHELTNAILASQKVFVPFDNVAGGKQVSSIVTCAQGRYVSFSLVDSDTKYLGPVGVMKADVPSEAIAAWLDEQSAFCEVVQPARVDMIESSFLLDGEIETVIEGVDIWGQDGRILELRRAGAAYSYGLVLTAISEAARQAGATAR